LLLQDHLTMSPCRVKQQQIIFKTGKFSVAAKMRWSTTAARTRCGREFQARAAATGKERLPIVVRHVNGISREIDSVERSCRPEERLDAGRIHSLRYCGAVPLRQRYVSTHSRNWIRSRTLSQCSSWSSGVVWADLFAENTSLAAAFSTDWKLLSKTAGAPANTELQYSSLLITSAHSRVIKAGRVREWRTEFIWRSIAKHARTVEVTWARMVASASR